MPRQIWVQATPQRSLSIPVLCSFMLTCRPPQEYLYNSFPNHQPRHSRPHHHSRDLARAPSSDDDLRNSILSTEINQSISGTLEFAPPPVVTTSRSSSLASLTPITSNPPILSPSTVPRSGS